MSTNIQEISGISGVSLNRAIESFVAEHFNTREQKTMMAQFNSDCPTGGFELKNGSGNVRVHPDGKDISVDFDYFIDDLKATRSGHTLNTFVTVLIKITDVRRLLFREENIKEEFAVVVKKPDIHLWAWACEKSEKRFEHSDCDEERTMWELANLNGPEWEQAKSYAASLVGSGH